jgi:RimJ/RimL family protein N-acetyltransferase
MTTTSTVGIGSEVSPARYRRLDGSPTFVSRRFAFRDFVAGDIRKMAGVAREYPRIDATAELYRPTDAEEASRWLDLPTAPAFATPLHWAISSRESGHVIGYSGLNDLDPGRRQAKLRFWIGCDATECVAAVVNHAFNTLALHRVYALQLTRQPWPGQILADVNMTVDGYLRKRIHSRGMFEDIACWSITTDMWTLRFD